MIVSFSALRYIALLRDSISDSASEIRLFCFGFQEFKRRSSLKPASQIRIRIPKFGQFASDSVLICGWLRIRTRLFFLENPHPCCQLCSHLALPKCGPNERLEACDGCPQPSCVHQDIPNKPCILKCYRPGCVCAEGYYRDDRYGGRGGCITRRMCNGP